MLIQCFKLKQSNINWRFWSPFHAHRAFESVHSQTERLNDFMEEIHGDQKMERVNLMFLRGRKKTSATASMIIKRILQL